jgi:hypothetical protein
MMDCGALGAPNSDCNELNWQASAIKIYERRTARAGARYGVRSISGGTWTFLLVRECSKQQIGLARTVVPVASLTTWKIII